MTIVIMIDDRMRTMMMMTIPRAWTWQSKILDIKSKTYPKLLPDKTQFNKKGAPVQSGQCATKALILFYFIPLREPHYPTTGWNQTPIMTCLGPAVSCWPSVTFTSCWRKDLEAVSSWESSLSNHNHQLTKCSFDHHQHHGQHNHDW